jgi:prefoldin subunit 5
MDELSQLKADLDRLAAQEAELKQNIQAARNAAVNGQKLLLANHGAQAYITSRIETLEGDDEAGPKQDA